MPLVAAKCTSCGAVLKVDDGLDAAVCEYCRTPFIIEKAINNYQIHNDVTIQNSEVHIHGGLTSEEKIKNAMDLLDIHRSYDKAEEQFRIIIEECPNDYRGWIGLIRTKTHDYSFFGVSGEDIREMEKYAQSVRMVCKDQGIISDFDKKWGGYKKSYSDIEKLVSDHHELDRKLDDMTSKRNPMTIPLVLTILSAIAGGLIVAMATSARVTEPTVVYGYWLLGISGLFLLLTIVLGILRSRKKGVINEKRNQILQEINKIDSQGDYLRTHYFYQEAES